MQSGTTGINTIRIYNPVKQGHDQDPTGAFTRRWLPELAAIEDRFLQEPWLAPNAGHVLGRAYPAPIVDHLSAAKFARERMWGIRQGRAFGAQAAFVAEKHASRKGQRDASPAQRGRRAALSNAKKDSAQLSFPFD